MKSYKFITFILCYNRPEMCKTLETLHKCNYKGDYKLVIGKDDPKLDKYIENYGNDNIYIFDKNDYLWVDKQDTFGRMNCVVYARNAVFDIAKYLDYDYFVVLDDDYSEIRYRFEHNGSLSSRYCKDADELFNVMFQLLESSEKISCVALAQTGDYIGGLQSSMMLGRSIRKIMNSWFCSTHKRIYFTGTINEDTTLYTTQGSKGKIFLTVQNASINQADTQQLKGGLTEIYLNLGTYIKSFYSLMSCPSAVKLNVMGDTHYRIHHRVEWDNCVPKIISGRYKK